MDEEDRRQLGCMNMILEAWPVRNRAEEPSTTFPRAAQSFRSPDTFFSWQQENATCLFPGYMEAAVVRTIEQCAVAVVLGWRDAILPRRHVMSSPASSLLPTTLMIVHFMSQSYRATSRLLPGCEEAKRVMATWLDVCMYSSEPPHAYMHILKWF
ncbi:hypothetical protein K505DRAFT_164020 [Melanomma pulvis-pyrius CBS 109.77]|uniref:Uncharacterized protein n=1 Tax=Melanomma pulvis-pyrius CBS 109.77 TaxID=1314802 RepID=A0A6A6WNT3_9PLEO|nr:hypothetical protein K505DRAFT_164020 [Melanomma pulvis-pyrius CBS 109.77]